MSPTSSHSLLCLFDPHSAVHTIPYYLSGIFGFSPIKSHLDRSCMYSNTLQLAITLFHVLLHFLGSSCCSLRIYSLFLIFLVWYLDFGIEVVLFKQMSQFKRTSFHYTLFCPNTNLLYPKTHPTSSLIPHLSVNSPCPTSPTS